MDRKNVPVSSVRGIDGVDGIVEAIVSVTNVVDSVNDVIVPGAYKTTLRKRNPKGVWSHDTNIPVAKTLKVEELMPGDERLPEDLRAQDAGALLVKMQFNLNTTRGKDAFYDVQFFGTEQEWSIGYSVPDGKSVLDEQTGVRFIKSLELYEYSPVIFGAAPNTRTLSVKDDVDEIETQDVEMINEKARGDYSDLNFRIPSGVKAQARTGLEWSREFNRGGTAVGKNTARYLLANDVAGPEKVRHIARYFPRHEVDLGAPSNKPGNDGYPGAGLIAWKLWGGTPGWRWAQKLVDAMNRRDEMKAGPKELSVGDFVSWNSSGGIARGRIEHVMRRGTLGVPGSSFSIRATEQDPAALIRIWRSGTEGWEETETLVGHKFSTLTKIQSLKADQSKDVFTDMPEGEPTAFGTPQRGRRRRRRETEEGKPYRISHNIEACSGYAVIKEGESSPVPGGCHETLRDARRHMAALYAAETRGADAQQDVKAVGGPIRGHSTSVSDKTRLNRQAILSVRSPADPAYYRKIFAYQTKGTDGTRKTHYTFIHHFVSEDGTPGAAAMSELRAQMTVLNGGRTGTTLRGAERRAVYNHLARHYRDGGETPPSLKSDQDVDTIMIKNGIISEPLTKVENIDE